MIQFVTSTEFFVIGYTDSPYLDKFNAEILKMQENGDLDRLKRKWWKEEGKETAETCPVNNIAFLIQHLIT